MKTAIKLGMFRIGFVALTLSACSAALAESKPLGTVFYSPAERAELVAARSGLETRMGEKSSFYFISGFIKREGDKSVAWINGHPVSEKPQQEGAPPIRVFRDGVLIDGKPAKVGETLDATSGARSSALPPDAVTVIK
ncbi:MAG: hypothetical protein PHQ60_11820 [Sideroxydans sp.]|nr:hypothetical protein [Sideroxydans sp.]